MGKGDVLTIDMNSAAGTNGVGGAEVVPLIELRDVVFSYAGHTVVDGVSLQVIVVNSLPCSVPTAAARRRLCVLLTALNSRTQGHTCLTGTWSMRRI